jgi:hypothetical protein
VLRLSCQHGVTRVTRLLSPATRPRLWVCPVVLRTYRSTLLRLLSSRHDPLGAANVPHRCCGEFLSTWVINDER